MTKKDAQRMARLCQTLGRMNFGPNEIGELLSIERSLHRLAEADCNVGLTPRQERRADLLSRRAFKLAQDRGNRIYWQTDPRGCALYVLPGLMAPEGQPDDSHYSSNGIAVCL